MQFQAAHEAFPASHKNPDEISLFRSLDGWIIELIEISIDELFQGMIYQNIQQQAWRVDNFLSFFLE